MAAAQLLFGKRLAAKTAWPMWKILPLIGLLLIVTIPLGAVLGVVYSRKNHGSEKHDRATNKRHNKTDIWQPKVGESWQVVLLDPIAIDDDGKVEPNVTIYDVDLFDNDADTFKALHKTGKKVICYFSAGTYENWRDDKDQFEETHLGKELEGWSGERWVDVRNRKVRDIMKKRIEYAAKKGCDAIDPDNVDGFQNDNGLGLTQDDAVDFVKFLSETAAAYNMSTGLKNNGDIIPEVLDVVHFSVNEQCIEYSECETFAAFIKDGKPVFNIEYPAGAPDRVLDSTVNAICGNSSNATGTKDFSTVIKNINLDGWVRYCDERSYTTDLKKSN
ncbi:glycoside hydrolase superfamily [Fusarium oxysporum f. sp. albedinis]|nr:hypothetical protein FOMA001_g14910 [Fusarium oxysporum f. sp. matthiolae]KAI3580709.1 glycoside hydrolase superfamily [Fusarium oxysporum f. sp. albedinis]KAK2471509.1 hypothetical protein H9L39_16802 [Fusarium oxysporum f. sp. albedinis]